MMCVTIELLTLIMFLYICISSDFDSLDHIGRQSIGGYSFKCFCFVLWLSGGVHAIIEIVHFMSAGHCIQTRYSGGWAILVFTSKKDS